MTTTIQHVAVMLIIIRSTTPSISGVTFHDDFDFEMRYQKPYECDPFYYHPLHLPPHCAKMYQQKIQGMIGQGGPITVLTNLYPPVASEDSKEAVKRVRRQIMVVPPPQPPIFWGTAPVVLPPAQDFDYATENEKPKKKKVPKKSAKIPMKPKTPYDEMIESINIDIASQPSQGVIKMSSIGPVAVYNQAVSTKSEQLIIKLAKSSIPHDFEEDEAPEKIVKKKDKKKKNKKLNKKKENKKSSKKKDNKKQDKEDE